jgi:hypothetical protein
MKIINTLSQLHCRASLLNNDDKPEKASEWQAKFLQTVMKKCINYVILFGIKKG